ncbi:hypothetical protein Bbelb_393450 [Branchiostoma belcheri]|nr:hypothetical protein Bbelb_393450 [Branchiostoma belcheri]
MGFLVADLGTAAELPGKQMCGVAGKTDVRGGGSACPERLSTVDKLRPIPLTSIFAKICKGFVAKWTISDISANIEPRQFGGIKRSSTAHCMQCGLETLKSRRVNLCRKCAVSIEKSERTTDLLPPTRGQ